MYVPVPRFYALLLSGEEGSKENLVGLDVGDRPLFVQVSPGLSTCPGTPIYLDSIRNVFLNRLWNQGLTKNLLTLPSDFSSSWYPRAQFAANDPDVLLQAAKLVEKHCDAVDINLCVLPIIPWSFRVESEADGNKVVRLRWW